MIIIRKERYEAEWAALRNEWRDQMERSLKAVADQVISNLKLDSEAVEKEVALRVAGMGRALSEVTMQSEAKLSLLNDALSDQDERSQRTLLQLEAAERRINDESARLAQAAAEVDVKLMGLRRYLDEQNDRLQELLLRMQTAEERLGDQLSRLDLLTQAAAQDIESRANAAIDATSQEITRRAEEVVAAWSQQLSAVRQAAATEVDRFSIQLQADLGSRLEGTNETLRNIETATRAAQEALRFTQESIARSSEKATEAAAGRMQEFVRDVVGNFERLIEESGRAATAKWLAELEGKATDATYAAFGSLFKVSEWCEKKSEARMQAVLENGLNAASDNVREKAEAALQDFSAKVETATGQISAFVQTQHEEIRSAWEKEGEQLTSRLRAAFADDAQATLTRASQDLSAHADAILATVRSEAQTQENRLKDTVAQLCDQAVQAHEIRVEQVSRLALQEAIAKFSQETGEHLETLVHSAQQRLQQACSEVFAEVGDALSRRMAELTLRPAAKAATTDSR